MTNFNFKIITSKGEWEKFVAVHNQANFLQSYNWAEFARRLHKNYFLIGIFAGSNQIGAALVIKEQARRGDYLALAGGPLLDWQDKNIGSIFAELTDCLKKLARSEKANFVRVRPQQQDSPELRTLFEKNGYVLSPMHLTADLTLRLDLTMSDDTLLAKMRKNTRYEIKRALKLGITTQVIKEPAFLNHFFDLQVVLAKKHHFVPFNRNFLRQQFLSFLNDDQVALINASYNNQLLASAFVIFYQKEAVYHYGVSSPEIQRLPGSYAAQWAAIAEAKRRGCLIYNFWGVSPLDRPHHRFAGPSLFKRGFGGYEVQHLPAHDLPCSSSYPFIRGFELIRKKFRHLA